ncbi:hypothetical protein DES40_0407 [Litorimonas taeanensis]|uniref:Beta-barrel assembly complex subunit BamF n=1 Tax=Litorimonas taeanensis TaxID=568099 RepID=A0A420WJI3_9PROT|nr:hypothetical protein [Litorimonas taeanensis]RKQ71099.1 hypothetical protein DES40_0407 [Litorimonas taeanensis]
MPFTYLLKPILATSLVFTLSACASSPIDTFKRVGGGASKTASEVRTGEAPKSVEGLDDSHSFADVVLTPLEDINVRKDEIPPILLTMDSPYFQPEDSSCFGLYKEILEYDGLLGPDFDADEQAKRSSKIKAYTAASSVVGSVIPFRGLVRTATGAASYDKDIERAYRKGVARRAFLKGLANSNSCYEDDN